MTKNRAIVSTEIYLCKGILLNRENNLLIHGAIWIDYKSTKMKKI